MAGHHRRGGSPHSERRVRCLARRVRRRPARRQHRVAAQQADARADLRRLDRVVDCLAAEGRHRWVGPPHGARCADLGRLCAELGCHGRGRGSGLRRSQRRLHAGRAARWRSSLPAQAAQAAGPHRSAHRGHRHPRADVRQPRLRVPPRVDPRRRGAARADPRAVPDARLRPHDRQHHGGVLSAPGSPPIPRRRSSICATSTSRR